MNLQEFKTMLLTILPDVYHYKAFSKPDKYIVWAEDSESTSLYADNKKEEQAIQGTLDYFTKQEFDPIVLTIQNTLNKNEISWTLNSIQHEEDTKYTHYEWMWEVDSLG